MPEKKQQLLIVDDDGVFRERLALSFRRRGYDVLTAAGVEEALALIEKETPDGAVVDLKMPGEHGLELVRALKQRFPGHPVIVLTGYGSIATATEAIRLGAADYLTKPADADQIEAALFFPNKGEGVHEPLETPSLQRVEWEHLQRVLRDCDNNISRAARVLGIDRRSLQRKLQKYPPPR